METIFALRHVCVPTLHVKHSILDASYECAFVHLSFSQSLQVIDV